MTICWWFFYNSQVILGEVFKLETENLICVTVKVLNLCVPLTHVTLYAIVKNARIIMIIARDLLFFQFII